MWMIGWLYYEVTSILPYEFSHQQISGDFNDRISLVDFIGANANNTELVNTVLEETKKVVAEIKTNYEFAHLSLVKGLEALFVVEKVN